MKKNESNTSTNRIQNSRKNASVPTKNNRPNYSKAEKNINNRFLINSDTNIQKIQHNSNRISEVHVSDNVYALTEIESLTADPTNSSGSKYLGQQQQNYEEEELVEETRDDEIADKSIITLKAEVKIENTDIEQEFNSSVNNKPDQPQIQPIKNSLYSDPLELSSLQPHESSDQDSIFEKQLALFQKNGSIPDPSQHQGLIQYIQRQKVNSIISNNFKEASKLQSTFQNLINAINESQVHDTLKTRIEEIERKVIETNQEIEELNRETKSAIIFERYNLDQKKDEIIQNQETELDQFESKWNDEEFLRKFTKPSSSLIAKQSLQHSYVLMKDFDRAEELKNEIESMEKSESRVAQNKAENEMLKEQKKLIEKHQNEIDSFNQFSKRQIDIIKSRQEVKLEPLIARKKKLEIECNSLKKLRAEQLNSPSLPSIQFRANSSLNSPSPSSRLSTKTPSYGSRSGLANPALESVMTPRTLQRYSSYKTRIVNPKITLKPLGKIITKKDKKKFTNSKNRLEKF